MISVFSFTLPIAVVDQATAGIRDVLEDKAGRIGLVLFGIFLFLLAVSVLLHVKGDIDTGKIFNRIAWLTFLVAFILVIASRLM